MIIDSFTTLMQDVGAVVTQATKSTFEPENIQVIRLKETRGVVPWGEDNRLPDDIISYVGRNEILSANVQFNVAAIYGQGIKVFENQNGELVESTNPKVREFLENNDLNSYLLEQISDLVMFYNLFPEIILDKAGKNIVLLNSKEATYSRWETCNEKTGLIEHHLYSAEWVSGRYNEDNVTITPVLDMRNPLRDLRVRMTTKSRDMRFIVPIHFPTPGRTYYQRPYWWSVFESGWYDISMLIPAFKKALLTNQMAIKYHIQLHENYFDKIYETEKITDEVKKEERKKKELEDIRDYLKGAEKAGKTMVSKVMYSPDGKEIPMMKISVIDDKAKGGEYIEDSAEVSNILSYAMGVHPNLIGSSPGKNSGTLSGTDKRELFTIKQALIKPLRDMLLRPLNLIRDFNKWPENIVFAIPDIHLTTLDKGKDAEPVVTK